MPLNSIEAFVINFINVFLSHGFYININFHIIVNWQAAVMYSKRRRGIGPKCYNPNRLREFDLRRRLQSFFGT